MVSQTGSRNGGRAGIGMREGDHGGYACPRDEVGTTGLEQNGVSARLHVLKLRCACAPSSPLPPRGDAAMYFVVLT